MPSYEEKKKKCVWGEGREGGKIERKKKDQNYKRNTVS